MGHYDRRDPGTDENYTNGLGRLRPQDAPQRPQNAPGAIPGQQDGPLYLTDAERPYRPAELRLAYSLPLRALIKGIWYLRWFATEQDRTTYSRSISRIADRIEESE